MNNIVINGLGEGNNATISGFGGNAVIVTPYIIPTSGDINGGTIVYLIDSNVSTLQYSDSFREQSLSANWQSVTQSSGLVSVDDGLTLKIPATTAGVAGIITTYTFNNIDAQFVFNNVIPEFDRQNTITYCSMAITDDVVGSQDNMVRVVSYWDVVYGNSIALRLYQNAAESDIMVFRVREPARQIRMTRIGGSINVTIDNIYTSKIDGWLPGLMKLQISVEVGAVDIISNDLLLTSSSFKVSPIIRVGDGILDNVIEYDERIVGSTQAGQLPKNEVVEVFGLTSSTVINGGFTYTPDAGLTLNSQMVVDNDRTLRD